MAERLVDVKDGEGKVIHTYPVTLPPSEDADAKFRAKALEAAALGQLVPNLELGRLSSSLHVGRSGRLEPYGDDLAVNSETKAGLERIVRDRAYLLWEQEGSPAGRADEYWCRAHTNYLRERAYLLWEQAGMPEGCADEHWRRVCDFEAC
jgi:hypothetical protein